jgi:replicative DNA helicase Mcm
VSVAKAGIIATFKSESAVLAAANPKYSRFDPYKPPAEQFDIPASLISRFDLIFPIKDVMDATKDKELAEHMLNSHKLSQTLASGKSHSAMKETVEKLTPPIDENLLRKYIAYSRRNCHPIFTEEAMERLGSYYVDLRKRSSGGSVPLTPRQLEGLVRLAEASAKLRLNKKVEMADADRAIKLVEFVLREVGMEKDGGGFDIDRIVADHPKSERDKIYTITKIVKGLEEEYDMVPRERVLEEAKEYHDIDNRTAEKLIHELVNKGDLYEPRHGHLKTVSR